MNDALASSCQQVMRRSDFSFELPEELIAQVPLENRAGSRLLKLDGRNGQLQDLAFRDLPDLLAAGDILVFNDTRVIPARIFARKQTGGRVELLIDRLVDEQAALAHLRASKSPRLGSTLLFADRLRVEVVGRAGSRFHLRSVDAPWRELMARYGQVPLPPYIRRQPDTRDTERYQTIFARQPGAVAAPTAGLHFDTAILDNLALRQVETASITLHVGAGTFQPVREDDLNQHVMHAEWLEVGRLAVQKIKAARNAGGRVIAVGTTTVRSLETAALASAVGTLEPYRGDSRLFIKPGFRFRVVDAMITNFHLPESTLLMLVSAFAGHDSVMASYRHAVRKRYRFFSYGDAMFIDRRPA